MMDRLLALKASAGSGKTFSLTVRYISLLFLGANPSNIIALTFTKKAAFEMKERIQKTLVFLEQSDELNEICKETNKNKDEILKKKEEVLKLFSKSPLHIETIDAFFAKILRKFSLHLGIMPDFDIADTLHLEKLEKLFIVQAFKHEKSKKDLVDLMIQEQKKLSNIFELFAVLYEKSKEFDFSTKVVSNFISSQSIILKAKEIKQYLQDKGASKRAIAMFDEEEPDVLLSKTFWSRETLEYNVFSKVYSLELDRLFFALKDACAVYCKQKEAFILVRLFSLFILYKSTNEKLTRQTNELTFNDVSFFVHKLLRDKEISNDFLYFRLDGECEHLLIDEFQDTNFVQADILEPIIEEISSGIGIKNKRTFFYVGDTKQSIYRFRGGSKELFKAVADKYKVCINSLDTNYRSYGNLVEFVNETFKKPVYEDFNIQRSSQKSQGQGYVKVQTCEDDEDSMLENLQIIIAKLLDHDIKEENIAVLCHTNKEASLIKESLQKWSNVLPVSIENKKALLDSLGVKTLVEFLKYNYFGYEIHEKNTLVLLGHSFEEKLNIKIQNLNAPLPFLLVRAVDLLGLNGADEDILYFIELASAYENLQSLLFGLERFGAYSLKSETLGIKVLTIHKSKGLEFDNVIVLDRLKQTNRSGSSFLFEYDNGRLKTLHVRMKNREYVDIAYKKAKEKEEELKRLDAKNVFYVAFTRAKKSLFILQKNKNSSLSFLGLSDFEQGELEKSKQKQNKVKVHTFSLLPSYGLQNAYCEDEVDESEYDLEKVYFGLALHYLLELASDFREDVLEEAIKSVRNKYGDFVDVDEVLKRAKLLVCHEEFLSLIKGGKLTKEQALMYKGQRRQLDLLVEFEDKYFIIDYKTSYDIHKNHIKQVQSYKEALESIVSKNVEAFLVYFRKNDIKIHKI